MVERGVLVVEGEFAAVAAEWVVNAFAGQEAVATEVIVAYSTMGKPVAERAMAVAAGTSMVQKQPGTVFDGMTVPTAAETAGPTVVEAIGLATSELAGLPVVPSREEAYEAKARPSSWTAVHLEHRHWAAYGWQPGDQDGRPAAAVTTV